MLVVTLLQPHHIPSYSPIATRLSLLHPRCTPLAPQLYLLCTPPYVPSMPPLHRTHCRLIAAPSHPIAAPLGAPLQPVVTPLPSHCITSRAPIAVPLVPPWKPRDVAPLLHPYCMAPCTTLTIPLQLCYILPFHPIVSPGDPPCNPIAPPPNNSIEAPLHPPLHP